MLLLNGDCLEEMKKLEDNSVDSIVTDPPYGLGKEPDIREVMSNWIEKDFHKEYGGGFMGKEWDSFVPSPIYWKECLRVLKPGGHILCFAGTRTQDLMSISLRFAGFEIRDTIMFVHAQGFPKSLNIGLEIEKKLSDNPIQKIERIREDGRTTGNRNTSCSFNHSPINLAYPEIKLDLAKQHEGFGTNLKPAYEPIIIARKKISESTIVENVLKYGCGGINIDGCRISLGEDKPYSYPNGRKGNAIFNKEGLSKNLYIPLEGNIKGRWPSNFIIDDSEEVMQLFPHTKSGAIKKHHIFHESENNCMSGKNYERTPKKEYSGDDGSAARFFYCAKASQKDRNEGCENLNNTRYQAGNYSKSPICKTCNKTLNGTNNHSNCSGEVYYGKNEQTKGNNHPTVKSTELMQYLVRLVTPPKGIVFDPFMGSGSTGKAAVYEGFDFIGIEKEKEYFEIAKARIDFATKEKDKELF
jgi:site-specific DNA-methyltransferase (adenine-specific)